MKYIIIISLLIFSASLYSQGNCLIYPKGSGERKACELCYKATEYAQGSKESQIIFDSAIAVGPKFAWAYYEKSVPYLKRGFLYEGLQILNKAVDLDPLEYLCYRASWYWQYKNYELCIQDLEKYYSLPNAYPQFTPGGEKNMKIVLALAYAKVNNYEKAIKTIKDGMDVYRSESDIGFTDYHTLGLLYLKDKQYDKAIDTFKKQFTIIDEIAESHYLLGLAFKEKSNFEQANIQFKKALSLFDDSGRYRISIPGFRTYKSDVIEEIGN